MTCDSSQLATRARQTLQLALRPATRKTYHRMFKEFLGLLMATLLCHHKVDHFILIMFMQYLSENGCSASNIANYMARVRSQCIMYDIDTSPFRYEQIQLFYRSIGL